MVKPVIDYPGHVPGTMVRPDGTVYEKDTMNIDTGEPEGNGFWFDFWILFLECLGAAFILGIFVVSLIFFDAWVKGTL